jgi:hypothetical protein
MQYEQLFLRALALTLIVEVPVVFLLVKYWLKKSAYVDIVFSGIIASSLTLPYFWFVLPVYIFEKNLYNIAGEILIIIVESLIYWRFLKLKFGQALFVSLVANLASILIGIMFI